MMVKKNFFKLDKKIFKESFFTVSEQIFSSFVIFIIGIFLARSTSKDDFAFYVLSLSVVMILVGFQKAILTTPYAILFENELNAFKDKYRTFAALFQLSILCLIILIAVISVPLSYKYLSDDLFQNTLSFMIFLLSQIINYYFKYTLIAELRVVTNFFYCSAIYLGTLIVCLTIYVGGLLNTSNYFLYSGTLSIFLSWFFYIFFFKSNLTWIAKNEIIGYLKNHFSLGKWILGSNTIFIFSSQIYPWALLFFWNKESVADLGIILIISRVFTPAIHGISSYLLPKLTLYTSKMNEFKELIFKLVVLMLFLSIILIAFGFYAGEYLVEMLYSSKYKGLGLLITLSFMLQAISLVNIPIDSGLNAMKRTDLGFNSLVFSLILTIFIGLPLTWRVGVEGVLIGMLLSLFGALILRINYLKKEIRVKK